MKDLQEALDKAKARSLKNGQLVHVLMDSQKNFKLSSELKREMRTVGSFKNGNRVH